jgi:octaprenyl-diphosphate synthase
METIRKEMARLERFLIEITGSGVPFIDNATRYVIDGGGKRIRPALVILTSKLCGYGGKRAIIYGAIIELIHTATLLHDDVLDNAKLRRGRPSVNHLWGNEPCVLLGDFFYSKAVEIMGEDGDKELIKIVSGATVEVAKGEILEILKTGDLNLSEEEYFEIIGSKTAALFSASCEIGAVLAKKGKKTRDLMKEFGKNLGYAFQLTDDALDYLSTDMSLGKKIGTDLKEKKVTLPLIYALRMAKKEEREVINSVFKKSRISAEDFSKVKKIVESRGGFAYTYRIAAKFIDEAKRQLMKFPHSPYKINLTRLAETICERKS